MGNLAVLLQYQKNWPMKNQKLQRTHYHETCLKERDTDAVLKENSMNIQRKNTWLTKQQNNSINTCLEAQLQTENPSFYIKQEEIDLNSEFLQQPLLSIDVSEIDDRDDFLLSSSTLNSQFLLDSKQTICKIHDKAEDIICMVEKIKICSYCALFGCHKDHSFKSEQQLMSEIEKKQKQITQLKNGYKTLTKEVSDKQKLRLVVQFCEEKKNQKLKEIDQEYYLITSKLNEAKKELQSNILNQYNTTLKQIKDQWQRCQIDIENCKLFKEWQMCANEVLLSLKQTIFTQDFAEHCVTYQQFPWKKGQFILTEGNKRLKQFSKSQMYQIQSTYHGSSQSLKSILAITLHFDTQNIMSSNLDDPITSIQQFQHHRNSLSKISIKDSQSCNEFTNDPFKFRHSQFIQSTLQPIQQSIEKNSRITRNSHYGLMNKRQSERVSNINEWNFSNLLHRTRSSCGNEQTIMSPKSRVSHCRSPRLSTPKQDPLMIVAQFERNTSQNNLNLSNCGLGDESLLYFIEKAFNSHIPTEINLSKNTISQSGFVKILPFLLKTQNVNLAFTGLGEGCLQSLSRMKGVRHPMQINLSENGISVHKNKVKIDHLKKIGLKVICH